MPLGQLIRAIVFERWDDIRAMLSGRDLSPFHSTAYTDEGDNAFSRACSQPNIPPDIILSMIKIDANNVTRIPPMLDDITPLTCACIYGSIDTVKSLLFNVPGRVKEYASVYSDEGDNSLDSLWCNYIGNLFPDNIYNDGKALCFDRLVEMNTVTSLDDLTCEMKVLLDKTNLLLVAGTMNSIDNIPLLGSSDWNIIHVVVALIGTQVDHSILVDDSTFFCPTIVLWFMLKLYPEKVCSTNENGDLPIHIAAASIGDGVIIDTDDIDYLRDDIVAIINTTNKYTIDMLLELYPEAARIRNRSGMIPLYIAIDKYKSSALNFGNAIDSLIKAAPDVLDCRDVKTHMFPFMLAAARDLPLDVIYNLLQASPMTVSGGIASCTKEKNLEVTVPKPTRNMRRTVFCRSRTIEERYGRGRLEVLSHLYKKIKSHPC